MSRSPSCPYAANGIVPLEHRQTCAHRSPSHQHVTEVLVALRDVATCCPWLRWLLSVPCPPPPGHPRCPLAVSILPVQPAGARALQALVRTPGLSTFGIWGATEQQRRGIKK